MNPIIGNTEFLSDEDSDFSVTPFESAKGDKDTNLRNQSEDEINKWERYKFIVDVSYLKVYYKITLFSQSIITRNQLKDGFWDLS